MSDITQAPRSGYILSCNSGSSSLKISIYQLDPPPAPPRLILVSSISSITAPPATFTFEPVATSSSTRTIKDEVIDSVTDHASGFAHFLNALHTEANIDKGKIVQVCHRVVHGGDYSDPVVISDETYHHIEKLSDLAPLYASICLLF